MKNANLILFIGIVSILVIGLCPFALMSINPWFGLLILVSWIPCRYIFSMCAIIWMGIMNFKVVSSDKFTIWFDKLVNKKK